MPRWRAWLPVLALPLTASLVFWLVPEPAPLTQPLKPVEPVLPAGVDLPTQAAADLAPAAFAPVEEASVFGSAFHRDDRAPFSEFARWVKNYQNAAPEERAAAVETGVSLAKTRRAALRELIGKDPVSAISVAVPVAERDTLPRAVVAALETRVSGAGQLQVLGVTPIPDGPQPAQPIIRTIKLQGRKFFVSASPRAKLPAITGPAAVQGIAIDDDLAVADAPPADITLPQSAFGDASFGSDATTGKPLPAHTHGAKKVIVIRVDYSDLAGTPVLTSSPSTGITPAYVTNLFNQTGGIGDFYVQNSYGASSLTINTSDVTPVYRMPHTAAYYAQGNGSLPYSGTLQEDAVNAAITDGYDISQYDRIGVVTSYLSLIPDSKVGFAGVSEIGGANFLINGYFNFSVVAHEIGHTYGIYHANWWDPDNGTTVGTETDMLYNFFNGAIERVSKEYGDRYDVMGDAGVDIRNHFNPWFKSILGWLPNSAVQTVLTPGTYRLYRHDHASADLANHAVALKVGRDILRNYWISYRRQPLTGTNINNGATIQFGYFVNRASDLLVCNNPGVNVDQAALEVGQTFTDPAAGVSITALAQGGSGTDEYLDIGIALAARVSFQTSTASAELPAASTATVLVDRLGDTTGTTTVTYQTIDQTALAGTHYAATSGTLTWLAGDSAPKPIVVPLIPYPTTAGAVSFSIQLSNAINGVLINPSTIDVSLRPPGNPDPAYLADATNDSVLSVALTPDGKQLIAGKFTLVGMDAPINAGRYARLLPNGKRDKSFNSTVGADGEVDEICAQPDGKVLIGGAFTNVNNANPARPKLARLLADGTVDPTFSPPTLDGNVQCLAVQPDGKIVVGGFFNNVGGQPCLGLCRLLPSGTVDFRFNDPSYILNNSIANGAAVRAVVLDSFAAGSGVRIIAAGDLFQPANLSASRAGVVRLLANGSVDSSFNIGSGSRERGTAAWRPRVESLALQSDGKLLVGGWFTAFGSSNQKYLIRLDTTGSPDPAFAPAITGAPNVAVSTILPQPDGKVVFGGTFRKVNGAVNSNLIRVLADGSFDSTWDNGTLSANGSTTSVTSLVLRPDGRLIVGITSVASPFLNFIRGAAGPREYSNVAGGISTQTLFTGLAARNGVAQLAGANGTVKPGQSISINVQRANGSAGSVGVDYSTQEGTALAGTDYQAAQGTLTWADGDTTPRTINITAPAGATAGRKFSLNLGIPRGGLALGSPAAIAITLDSSAPPGGTVNSLNGGGTGGSLGGTLLTGTAAQAFMSGAFGFASASSSIPHLPQTTVAGDHLRIIFTRDPGQPDIDYEAQASTDLVSWTTIARSSGGQPTLNLGAAVVAEAAAGSLVQVTVDDSVAVSGSTQRFLRVKLSK